LNSEIRRLHSSTESLVTKQCSIPRRLTMIRQNPVCLNRLGLLRKTGHNVRLTESPRVAKPIRDSFTVSNRLGRRQQTTGKVQLMSDSLSSAPRNQRRPNSRTLRSDYTNGTSLVTKSQSSNGLRRWPLRQCRYYENIWIIQYA